MFGVTRGLIVSRGLEVVFGGVFLSSQDTAVTALMSSDTWIGLNDITNDDNFVWVGTNSSPSYTNW